MNAPLPWKRTRDLLNKQRTPLSKEFDKNPNDLRLALKIKGIDDEIAVCTEHMTKERQLCSAELSLKRTESHSQK